MSGDLPVRGVFCAAATPVAADLSPDLQLFAAHCRQLISDGVTGIALLGTTGEANSFDLGERRAILEAALDGGIAPDRLMPGTGVAAVPDSVALTRHALSVGVNRVVMLPPYYYKGVSDDGLFDAYRTIIDRIADDRLQVVLYHIPQVSGVPLSLDLIGRLVAAYPKTVVGIKDSSGDFENMRRIVETFAGFSVFAGADPLMMPLLKIGGAGCITAASNLMSTDLRTVFDGHADPSRADAVAAAQRRVETLRSLSNRYPQIATIKAMIAWRTGEAGWTRVRPPLRPLDEAQRADIDSEMAKAAG